MLAENPNQMNIASGQSGAVDSKLKDDFLAFCSEHVFF